MVEVEGVVEALPCAHVGLEGKTAGKVEHHLYLSMKVLPCCHKEVGVSGTEGCDEVILDIPLRLVGPMVVWGHKLNGNILSSTVAVQRLGSLVIYSLELGDNATVGEPLTSTDVGFKEMGCTPAG